MVSLSPKRGKSLLKTMREKTPRRSQEKAENPSIASALMMTMSKSIGINSDLRVKSLRRKTALSVDQRSPKGKRESLRLKEDSSELSSLLNDNQTRSAENIAGYY